LNVPVRVVDEQNGLADVLKVFPASAWVLDTAGLAAAGSAPAKGN